MTIPGPWTGMSPSIARRRVASAASSWSAAELPPDCSAAFLCVRSAVSADSASLARCRSSIKKARVVVSVPTRLFSTSAWLRICTVATSATRSAMSHIPIARPDLRRAGAERLRGADMGYLQARVVSRQLHVWFTRDGERDLEPDLAIPKVWERGRIVERDDHAIPIADGEHLNRRPQRRTLVDDDLAFRARKGRKRREPAPGYGHALGPVGEEKVDHVLHVLVVDQVADLHSNGGRRRAVAEVDLDPRPVDADQARMSAQVGDLVLKGLGGGRLLGGRGLESADIRAEGGDLGAPRIVGLLQVL